MKASFILFTFALYLSLPAFSRPADGSCKEESPMSGSPKAQIDSLVTAAQMAENNDGMKAADAARNEEVQLLADIELQKKQVDLIQERVTRGDDSNGFLKRIGFIQDEIDSALNSANRVIDLEWRLDRLRVAKNKSQHAIDALMRDPALKEFLGEE